MRRRTFVTAGALAALPVGPLARAARGSSTRVLVAAGDMNHLPDTRATGALAAAQHPDVVATLGDQQYPAGSHADYLAVYDRTPWGRRLKGRTRPVPGHHEYDTRGARGYFSYFGVRPYYAYEIGAGWRGYALNSLMDIHEQVRWLRADLARHPGAAVVASWSDPLRSSGTKHGGNRAMRPLWQALSGRHGVVLNGHEHHYERLAVRNGLRSFVVGTGGRADYRFGPPLPASRARIRGVPGVLVLTLRTQGRYSWAFKNVRGRTLDSGESATG